MGCYHDSFGRVENEQKNFPDIIARICDQL